MRTMPMTFIALLLLLLCACAAPTERYAIDPEIEAFGQSLKASISRQTMDNLRREAVFQGGFATVQFHYQDGKILDANVIYLLGYKPLGEDVVQQLMKVEPPPPIPRLVGKRIRFIVGFCLLSDEEACREYQKRGARAAQPESGDAAEF